MKKITIICDACGREIQPSYFRSARLDFKVDKWDGGSVGGREDIFIQEATYARNAPISYRDL